MMVRYCTHQSYFPHNGYECPQPKVQFCSSHFFFSKDFFNLSILLIFSYFVYTRVPLGLSSFSMFSNLNTPAPSNPNTNLWYSLQIEVQPLP